MSSEIKFTKREIEILPLVVEGLTAKEIGKRLYVSRRTAEFHQARIRKKLGVTNKIEVTVKAVALGFATF